MKRGRREFNGEKRGGEKSKKPRICRSRWEFLAGELDNLVIKSGEKQLSIWGGGKGIPRGG